MSRNYKFHNPEGLYFVSFAVDYADKKGYLDNVVVFRSLLRLMKVLPHDTIVPLL